MVCAIKKISNDSISPNFQQICILGSTWFIAQLLTKFCCCLLSNRKYLARTSEASKINKNPPIGCNQFYFCETKITKKFDIFNVKKGLIWQKHFKYIHAFLIYLIFVTYMNTDTLHLMTSTSNFTIIFDSRQLIKKLGHWKKDKIEKYFGRIQSWWQHFYQRHHIVQQRLWASCCIWGTNKWGTSFFQEY